MTLEEYALYYAELGFAVFPLQPGTKIPFAGTNGHKEATTNAEIIRDWWSHVPNANIGIATQNLVVVDFDQPDHPWLNEKQFPACPISLTPKKNGRHYLYRQNEQCPVRCSSGKLADKIDIRADGGYIVAPPSIVPEGKYAWAPHCELTDDIDSIPYVPEWLSHEIALSEQQQSVSTHAGNLTSNIIPDGKRNSVLASLAGHMRRCGMSESEIAAALLQTNANRCNPPLPEEEVKRIARSIAHYEPDQAKTAAVEQHIADIHFGSDSDHELKPVAAVNLINNHQALKPPLINGILRKGETMNVVAAPKVGKSWLVLDMALAIAQGKPWLGTYSCQTGRVLIIDNELHPETSADRLKKVCYAQDVDLTQLGDRLEILNLRGRLQDLDQLAALFANYEPGHYDAIIIDAWYRAIPAGVDENDNGGIARMYNLIDRCAAHLQCSFILIHHTSKGNQAGKSVTDVGAGAGSQSRAADVHVGLRAHREEGAIVMDAAVRSWKPMQPLCLRFDFPLWSPAPHLDPLDLDTGKPRKKSEQEAPTIMWDPDNFTERFITNEPVDKDLIIEDAYSEGLSEKRTLRLLKAAMRNGFIYRWKLPGSKGTAYATEPPPQNDYVEPELKTDKRTFVIQKLILNRTLPAKEIAMQCGVSHQYVNKIKRELDHADS